MTNTLDANLARRWARQTFTRQKTASYARGLAPALLMLAFAGTAHAQGQIDFTGAQGTLTQTRTFLTLAGATVLAIGFIFAAVRFAGGRFQECLIGVAGVIVGGVVLGYGQGWIGSLSGTTPQ